MVELNKRDSRYKHLKAYLRFHLLNISFEELKIKLIEKHWPEEWIDEAYKDINNKESIKTQSLRTRLKSKNKNVLNYETRTLNKKEIEKEMNENLIENNNYLRKLLERKKEHKKHFYEKTVYPKETIPTATTTDSNAEVLKEAIKLAQEVIKSKSQTQVIQQTPQIIQTKQSQQAPIKIIQESKPIEVLLKSPKNNPEILNKEFEMQKQMLEEEKKRLKEERKEFFKEQKEMIANQTKNLHIQVENATIETNQNNKKENRIESNTRTQNKKEELKENKPKSNVGTQHLEDKLALLEQKLNNAAYNQNFESETKKFKNKVIVDEVEYVSEPVGDRAQTGIAGLDPIVQGGFRRLTANMVAGGPGSGKSLFAMEYLIKGITEFNEHGIYITFEQSKTELYKLFDDFGWDLKKLEKEKKLIILRLSPEQLAKMLESGGGSLRDTIDSIHASRIVIDSISDLLMLYKGDMAKRRICIDLFSMFSKMKCTTLVVSEQEVDPIKHISNVLEYQVDGVILLYNERIGDIRQRALEIFKMRGTKHAGRIFPMKITDLGIMILSEHPLNK